MHICNVGVTPMPSGVSDAAKWVKVTPMHAHAVFTDVQLILYFLEFLINMHIVCILYSGFVWYTLFFACYNIILQALCNQLCVIYDQLA